MQRNAKGDENHKDIPIQVVSHVKKKKGTLYWEIFYSILFYYGFNIFVPLKYDNNY